MCNFACNEETKVEKLRIIISLVLLLLVALAGNTKQRDKESSIVLNRMFSFQENYNPKVKDHSMQVYTKHFYQVHKRNIGLWLIPSMYTVAKGERKYLSEEYSKMTIKDANNYDMKRQVYYTTIPHNRETMSVLDNFAVPNLYKPTLYGKYILSPVAKENRFFYRYKVKILKNGTSRIDFRPLMGDNTQLVSGTIIVNTKTGRIQDITITGEYDMINFTTTYSESRENGRIGAAQLPRSCKTYVDFKFLGNHITSSYTSVFNSPKKVPDSTDVTGNRHLIDSLRPVKLTKSERALYAHMDSMNNPKVGKKTDEKEEETSSAIKTLTDFGMGLGDELLSSHGVSNEHYHIRLSPIIKPQYLSYSRSRGLSYKINFAAEYYLDKNSGFSLDPTFGYNFKIKKLYAEVPLRYIYDKRRENFLELSYNVGNRVVNSAVIEELKDELGELPELDDIKLDEFDDYELSLMNNVKLNKWMRTEFGLVYHDRKAVNKQDMERYGKATKYKSLAPSIGLFFKPWERGPMLSINYERGLKLKHFDLDYERWESKASIKINLPSTKMLNLQLGGGLYTKRAKNYFMDFANFTVNNLPGGWDDDWTGDFQLLDSRLYNISHYYLSSNVSYDSPLMMTSFIPILGRHVERERFYWSGLLIEYNRPYHELGYGFSTCFFSVGLFASFHELDFQKIGAKFTFELFHRW